MTTVLQRAFSRIFGARSQETESGKCGARRLTVSASSSSCAGLRKDHRSRSATLRHSSASRSRTARSASCLRQRDHHLASEIDRARPRRRCAFASPAAPAGRRLTCWRISSSVKPAIRPIARWMIRGILEAGGDQQADPGAPPRHQRVGADRGSMSEEPRLGQQAGQVAPARSGPDLRGLPARLRRCDPASWGPCRRRDCRRRQRPRHP